MTHTAPFEIFCVTVPGMEPTLLEEVLAAGFPAPAQIPGGVTFVGGWPDVWRANLVLRGATRVLARIGSFRAFHLAQLDKRARKFPWGDTLHRGTPVRVDVTTSRASKIYHAKAAAQRIETALREEAGLTIDPEATITLKVRIDDNLCTFSLDTSGAPLHIRDHKEAVNKAPMRENLAALFLRQCGYDGTQPVLDPMCGSGTFVIEAAEIARGLHPGRTRAFAFESFASFDPAAWAALRKPTPHDTDLRFSGSDRDAGATKMSIANATRAGVADLCSFRTHAISDLQRPDGPTGLVIVNPPYGGRIGNKNLLYGLYAALGTTLKDRFTGWRIGLVTSENGLAKATGLPFKPTGAPVPHGGIRVTLFQTGVLG